MYAIKIRHTMCAISSFFLIFFDYVIYVPLWLFHYNVCHLFLLKNQKCLCIPTYFFLLMYAIFLKKFFFFVTGLMYRSFPFSIICMPLFLDFKKFFVTGLMYRSFFFSSLYMPFFIDFCKVLHNRSYVSKFLFFVVIYAIFFRFFYFFFIISLMYASYDTMS